MFHEPWGYTLPSGYLGVVALSAHATPDADPSTGQLPVLHFVQSLLHVLTALTAYGLLLAFGARPPWAALGGLGVALHPVAALGVNRIEDNSFAVPLMLCLWGLYLQASQRGLDARLALLGGIAAGLGLAFRPVLVLMAPLVLIALARQHGARSAVRLGALLLGSSAATVLIISGVVKHSPELLPRQGAYNLFVGANPYTAPNLLEALSAEPSLEAALQHYIERDPPLRDVVDLDTAQPEMTRLALQWIGENPLAYAIMIPAKAANLFRPDYRAAWRDSIASAPVVYGVQTALALPIFLWIATQLWAARRSPGMGWESLPVVLVYLVPIALTQSDPRLRLPLDVVLWCDSIRLLAIALRPRD